MIDMFDGAAHNLGLGILESGLRAQSVAFFDRELDLAHERSYRRSAFAIDFAAARDFARHFLSGFCISHNVILAHFWH